MDLARLHKTVGEGLSAAEWNELVGAVEPWTRAFSRDGVGFEVGPEGFFISGGREWSLRQPAIICMALNVGPVDIQPFDAVQISPRSELVGSTRAQVQGNPVDEDLQVYRRVLEVTRPVVGCYGRFGISASEILVGDAGKVWISGICLCYIMRAHGLYKPSSFPQPDHADTVAGQGYLQISPLGAAEVLWIASPEQVGSTSPPYPAVIRLGHRNTSGVGLVQGANLQNNGVLEVLNLVGAVTVSDMGPGVVKVDHT